MSITSILRSMIVSINLEKFTQLVNFATGAAKTIADLKQENADLHVQLESALSNDKADAQAIADAQAKTTQAQSEAQTAKDAVAPLQAAIDADATEDEKVNALLDGVTLPIEPTAPTEVPVS